MVANDKPLRSALHDRHVEMKATMADEASRLVPLSYGNALDEVAETRRRAGIFDLSHFGRIRVRGDGALDLLEEVCAGDVAGQEDDTTLDTVLCNQQGGILDLCRLIRLADFWVLVTSPICREKVLAHLKSSAERFGAKVDDQTAKTTMLAVAGPAAEEILSAVLPFSISGLAVGDVKFGSLMIVRYIAERTNFTGQWGICVSVPNMAASQAWRFITEAAGDSRIAPAGLAAMDVLRVEAGLCRYGHEINETIDPFTCGLEGLLDFGHDFVGREALTAIKEKAPARRLIGLVGKGPRANGAEGTIFRQGASVSDSSGTDVGVVTSGTFSPSLGAPVAMALVACDTTTCTTELTVRTGDVEKSAEIVELPFFREGG